MKLLPILTAAAIPLAAAVAHAETINVRHAPTPPPTYVDLGAPGPSVGDVRIFHFDGTTDDGGTVVTDWIMTTTGVDTAAAGVESRVTTGVFSFSGFDGDQVLLEGVGLYPSTGSTFKAATTHSRAIIGGSGRFAGASGEVVSTHQADGSWVHVFHID